MYRKIVNFILDNLVLILAILGLTIYLGSLTKTISMLVVAIPGIILIANFGFIIYLTAESIKMKKNVFTVKDVIIIVSGVTLSIFLFWVIGFDPRSL
mgnify:CR=1 FL=1